MNRFAEKVYEIVRKVPRGKLTTYGAIAHALGTTASRAVGTALKNNRKIPETPCRRVVRSDRSVGQYLYGTEKKIVLLQSDDVIIENGKVTPSCIITGF